MGRLKAGLVGLGRMGAQSSKRLQAVLPNGWLPISHIENINENEFLQLTSICDSDTEKLDFYSKENINVNKYKNFKKLISVEKPDFLSIATRINNKIEILDSACRNNVKIVYAEKPLFSSIGQAKKYLSFLEKKNIRLGYGVNRRYHDVYIGVKKIIKSKELGELREIIIENNFSNLFWTHPHSVDLILFFADSKNVIYLHGQSSFRNGYLPDNLKQIDDDPFIDNALIKFDNNVTGRITRGVGFNTKLLFSKGSISIIGDGREVILRKINKTGYLSEPSKIKIKINKSSTQRIFSNLCQSYLNNKDLLISKNDILLNTQILLGILYSSNSKSSLIEINEIPDDLVCTGFNGQFYS